MRVAQHLLLALRPFGRAGFYAGAPTPFSHL